MDLFIRSMRETDWPQVEKIYQEGIATGFATFETQTPSFDDWDKAHMNNCRLVALLGEEIVGWAALSPVSSRCVYGGVGEVSVYIGKTARGNGVGRRLMTALIKNSEEEGLWTLQAGIFPENTGSIKLHEKVGFRLIGKRERIGKLAGVWKDNLIFERRSKIIGND